MPKRYQGQEAVVEALKYYKPDPALVTPQALHLIQHEGFVPSVYKDTKGIDTEGIGLTKEFIGKNFFSDVMPVFEQRARSVVGKQYDQLPIKKKKAILSAVYRGDLAASHNTAKLMRQGKWKEAATEYLNHDDYRASKQWNDKAGKIVHGVAPRMEENATAFAE